MSAINEMFAVVRMKLEKMAACRKLYTAAEVKRVVAEVDHHFEHVVWSLAKEQWINFTDDEKVELVSLILSKIQH